MFERRKCENCGKKIKDDWRYCPYCGEDTEDSFKIFDADKEFRKLDKIFEPKFPRPRRPLPVRRGISITITSGTGIEPRIEIKAPKDYRTPELGTEKLDRAVEKPTRVVKKTEEPETKIQRIGNRQVILIRLPDVKSEDDIEVKRLEQSIEIRAFAGDKAYFKLIPVPSNASVSREFGSGLLKIEVVK
jgi:uncharacterized membrane protein YvbJ